MKSSISESQVSEIKQIDGLIGGKFTLRVITTTGLEIGPKGTESIFVKVEWK